MVMHHVRSLEETTLARRVYEEQKANKLPGLVEETEEICRRLEVESVHTTLLDGKKYRKLVNAALHKENKRRLQFLAKDKTKCDVIFTENYGQREYLKGKDIISARVHYKTRFKLLQFAGNYKKDKRFAKTLWLCQCKTSIENESHLLEGNCRVYGPIRTNFGDIDTEEDLIRFFTEVLEERGRLEEEEQVEQEEEQVARSSPRHTSLHSHV